MTGDDRAGRHQGILVDWNDDRGFGFITPVAGGTRTFVHVSEFPPGRRPVAGCEVTYAELRDDRNRPRASQVRYVGAAPSNRSRAGGTAVALTTTTLFFALLLGLVALDQLHVVVVAVYGLLSGVAFLLYGADKSAAVQRSRRTPEPTLHTVALLGGWPGALAARPVFRHKTTKQPFRTVFWLTVIANCAALAWLVNQGSEVLLQHLP